MEKGCLMVRAFAATVYVAWGLAGSGRAGEAGATALRATILRIADRWVEGWMDKEWDEGKGAFKFAHGPYSDAFKHHYVAAVLLRTPESKLHGNEPLARRVVSDLLFHSRVFVEQCRDKGLRGYWTLNGASAKGVPVGSGSWASRCYIRACQLLDGRMAPEQQRAWREGARWLIAALTVDWKETLGPWWSTNKIADHVAGAALWHQVSREPQAAEFLGRQFEWFWRAFPEDGCADKYHNYFAKTLYRLAPVLFVPEARRYHEPLQRRIRMWRSFVSPNGLYDAALHSEPNCDETWFGKLGPVVALLLLGAPLEPELALAARHIVEQRLADHQTERFWQKKFDPYFGGHWDSLGLILEAAPQWEEALRRAEAAAPGSFAQLRLFDYWQGLGRVAVKTEHYHASCYLHWAWTWDFAPLGGILHHLYTPGSFRFTERIQPTPRGVGGELRPEPARCWLDWDPHSDPETGGERTGMVVARSRGLTLSLPPSFPDEAIISGTAGGRLYGFTHCRYRLGDALEVRTSNVFLNDAIVVLNTIAALKDSAFDALYVQQSLANPGDLTAQAANGEAVAFEPDNVAPKASVPHAVSGPFELRSRDGTGALAVVPLANSFAKQELVDLALVRSPYGDFKRVPHRAEAWRGYLPATLKKGEVFVADFAYVPRHARDAAPSAIESVRTPDAHGVAVGGKPSVVIGQSLRAGEQAAWTLGDFRCTGQLFAAETPAGKVQKASLYGRSLAWQGQAVVSLSRQAAVTVLPEKAEGIVDAGVGTIEVRTPQKAWRLFCANHEFPRMACLTQKLDAGPGEPESSRLSDVEGACRRFAALPELIETAARQAELDMLRRSAAARGQKLASEPRSAPEATREVLASHEAADREGKPVAAVMVGDAAAAHLPPVVAGQERAPKNYLVSFAEERVREAVKGRAEALCRASLGRPDAEKLCEGVRATEATLLTRHFGLPIRWTREHIPGQPDFFWRPILVGEEKKGEQLAATDWEKALTRYVAPGDRIWLALARLDAAAKLVGDEGSQK
ncbi:MAG: hypothetical protein FJ291_23395 [Planctomycetes bacterium]|nr:hypothetical protein [Planctomycetota bacterium]